jgi:hypothetical protein
MIGGSAAAVEAHEPLWAALCPGTGSAAPTHSRENRDPRPTEGRVHCGPSGAGHYAKMVHNGIEYGMMQAMAEGLDLLRGGPFPGLDLADITEAWRRGSVVSSWLLDLTAQALALDPQLSDYSGVVSDSGEGRWTVDTAVEHAVPVPVLAAALFARFRSRQEASFADKALSAMRKGFGGHLEPQHEGSFAMNDIKAPGRPAQIAHWQAHGGRALLARLAYPVIWAVNRPSMAWFGRLALDFALRANGIAINFAGRHGLGIAEERFLERLAPRLADAVIFDVGANNGTYAAHVRRLRRMGASPPSSRTRGPSRCWNAPSPAAASGCGTWRSATRRATLELHDFADDDGSTQASLSRRRLDLYTDRVVSHAVRCTTIDAFLEAEASSGHAAQDRHRRLRPERAAGARQAIAGGGST